MESFVRRLFSWQHTLKKEAVDYVKRTVSGLPGRTLDVINPSLIVPCHHRVTGKPYNLTVERILPEAVIGKDETGDIVECWADDWPVETAAWVAEAVATRVGDVKW